MSAMGNVLTMVVSDLRQKLTDGSVLAFAILVPLALMFVMNLVFSGVANLELAPVKVAVAASANDQQATVIPQVLASIPESSGLQITVVTATADEAPTLVGDGRADMAVLVPDGFGSALIAGSGPQVEVILGDNVGITGQVVTSIVDSTLAQLTAGTRAAAAGIQLGVPPRDVAAIAQAVANDAPPVQWREGQTASEQLGAEESVVAGQAGMFLLFTVGFGVLALVSERDQGTLARLLSMPMRPAQITWAKALVSMILGVLATTVLLVAGTLMFDNVDFGSPWVVAVLILLVVAASTSIMFIIVKFARTTEQASIAQSVVAIVLGMTGGAFFQIPATGVVGTILSINPVRGLTDGLGIIAGGGGVADLGRVAAVLIAFTAVCLALAWVIPDRKDAL